MMVVSYTSCSFCSYGVGKKITQVVLTMIVYIFFSGANASALALRRLHHEIALEGLNFDQVSSF